MEFVALTKDTTWPWSLPPFGPWALGVVALLLAILTIWTYLGVARTSTRRLFMILALRLAALALACLMIIRPSLAFRDASYPKSTLLVAWDFSESMTIKDEFNNQSRWEVVQGLMKQCEPVFQKLGKEQNVDVVFYQFAENVRSLDSNARPEGKRTDFGLFLQTLFGKHGCERNLRGLIVVSDGADNGTRISALAEAVRWRGIPCPIYSFGLGQQTTSDRQKDISITSIVAEPAPVPVKAKLTVKAMLDAPGFENSEPTFRLFIDDKEVLAKKETLRKTLNNEVTLTIDAPTKPGEIKLTLKVDVLPGELSETNNEIGTYVTVTKEGISVLLVDKPRFPEPQLICDALSSEKRIRLYAAWRRTDEAEASPADLLQLDKQKYDVIILGDVSARRLAAGRPGIFQEIFDLVSDKGTGLMMMGGYDSFGNKDWNDVFVERVDPKTKKKEKVRFASLLPVSIDKGGQLEEPIRLEPTQSGLEHYVMKLSDQPDANRRLWNELPELNGMTRLGREREGGTVLALHAKTKEPMLVGWRFGEGRVLAFAGDTTWRWQRMGQPKTNEGVVAHNRFWKQAALWLAKQDELEGEWWVRPDSRRMPSRSTLGFAVGRRGKDGAEVADARFDVTVVNPKGVEIARPTAREQNEERGTFWETDLPGEYFIHLRDPAEKTDKNPKPAPKATVRFLVYQDEAEMARRAADHDFLNKLSQASGGKFQRAEGLLSFLTKDFREATLPQAAPKVESWPDWRSNANSPFLVVFLLLFVTVICLEWFLRRCWGMV